MALFFTTTPVAFYDDQFGKENVPKDAKPIEFKDWQYFIEQIEQGNSLEADGDQIVVKVNVIIPNKKLVTITAEDFFNFFSTDEQEKLGELTLSNPKLFMFITKITVAKFIDVNGELFNGCILLKDLGILTDDRYSDLKDIGR